MIEGVTVTEVVVSAGRTFSHPHQNYSNLKPHLTLKATLGEGVDVDAAVKSLQEQAEQALEDHKNRLLEGLEEEHTRRLERSELERLQQEKERYGELCEEHKQRMEELLQRYGQPALEHAEAT